MEPFLGLRGAETGLDVGNEAFGRFHGLEGRHGGRVEVANDFAVLEPIEVEVAVFAGHLTGGGADSEFIAIDIVQVGVEVDFDGVKDAVSCDPIGQFLQ